MKQRAFSMPRLRSTLLASALLTASAVAADKGPPGIDAPATIDPAHWPQPAWPLPPDARWNTGSMR